jgi:hypothetical protein
VRKVERDIKVPKKVILNDLIKKLAPPRNRIGKSDGPDEHHFYEGAVMVAYATHLLRTTKTKEIRIHPDGMHGKQFDFVECLRRRGFKIGERSGKTAYGGIYVDDRGRRIVVNPKAGVGDVVAEVDGTVISAECKGGIINTRHSGQVSRLDKGLCEIVGRLMCSPQRGRQVAVIPYTKVTLRLAQKLAPRCARVGIEIALVKDQGEIIDVGKS